MSRWRLTQALIIVIVLIINNFTPLTSHTLHIFTHPIRRTARGLVHCTCSYRMIDQLLYTHV